MTVHLGVATWQAGPGQSFREATPAERGRGTPSQTANPAPSIACNDVVGRLKGFRDDPGFGAIVLDRRASTVIVLSDGTPPESLHEMAGMQPNGEQLNLTQAAYSAREMSEQVQIVSNIAGI